LPLSSKRIVAKVTKIMGRNSNGNNTKEW
jgi:hypothetical protein